MYKSVDMVDDYKVFQVFSPLQGRQMFCIQILYIGTPEKSSKDTKKIIPLDYVINIVEKKYIQLQMKSMQSNEKLFV